jgi:hypothetical protein
VKLLLSIFILSLFSSPALTSVYEPEVLWQKKAIKYCYVDKKRLIRKTSFKRKKHDYTLAKIPVNLRKTLDQVVQEQFNPSDTIVHFVGGADCSKDRSSDLYIIPVVPKERKSNKRRIPYGKASVGYFGRVVFENMYKKEFKSQPDGKKHFVLLNLKPVQYKYEENIAYEDALPYVLLHELGHILSFKHEHGRDEMKEDANCEVIKSKQGKMSETSKLSGDYDPYSIMNYCYLHSIIKKQIPQSPPELSERDKEISRLLYYPIL